MKLSPLDIRKQEFNRVMRGYDVDEVRAFLSNVATQMEDLIEEEVRAEQDLQDYKDRMGHLEDVQEALQTTLNVSRQNAEEARKAAISKAELIVHEAHLKAEEVLQKAEREMDRLRTEITNLETNRNQIVAKIRSVLNAELEMLKAIQPEPADKQRDGAVEIASLAFIDPEARKRREEILKKAAAVSEGDANPSNDLPETEGAGAPGADTAAGGDALPEVLDEGDTQQVQDISDVVAALKADVDGAKEGLDEPEQAEIRGEREEDQEEIQKIRRILDDLE